MAKIPSRGVDQFVLRFPDGLREQIRQLAEQSGRSMNAEIIARLERSLSGEGESKETRETIQKLRQEVSRLEGLNEGLGRTVAAFVDHLNVTDEGKQFILKKILEDEFANFPKR